MRRSNWIVAVVAVVLCGLLLWLWYALGFDRVDSPLDLVVAVVWWLVIAAVCLLVARAERKRRERMRTAFVGEGVLWGSERGVFAPAAGESEVDALQQALCEMEYPDEVADFPGKGEDEGETAAGSAAPPAHANASAARVAQSGDAPANVTAPDFKWVVRTKKFKIEERDDGDAAADSGAAGSGFSAGPNAVAGAEPAVGGGGRAKVAAGNAAAAAPEDGNSSITWEGEVLPANDPGADPVAFSSREELVALLAA